MAAPSAHRPDRTRRLQMVAFVLMLVLIGVQSFLLYQQGVVSKARSKQSDQLLTTFLQGDTAQVAGGSSVRIRLQNVRFKWSEKVYIDAGNMAIRAVPEKGSTVDFDDVESFHFSVQQSVVRIRPDVLAGMFNESIFNYPQSRVRDLKVSIAKDDGGVLLVELRGKINVVAWVPFTMFTRLSVDRRTNTLIILVDHLKVLGFIPATKIIRWTPLNLDRMIALPPNKSLWVEGNRIMVKPFGLFPPPRINGTIERVTVGASEISLVFAGEPIAAPKSAAKNYVYLRGGTSRFGRFRMVDTDILVLDQDQSNPFVFSLKHYAQMLPRSAITLPNAQSVRLTMPDFKGIER